MVRGSFGFRCPTGLKREAGENPARSRHCEGGAAPTMPLFAVSQQAEGGWEGGRQAMIPEPGDLPEPVKASISPRRECEVSGEKRYMEG